VMKTEMNRCGLLKRKAWRLGALLLGMAIFVWMLAAASSAQKMSDPTMVVHGNTKEVAQPLPESQPNEYAVGSGDVMHIDVWQEAELSETAVVRPDGNISVPLINEVKVSGMTPPQIQQTIAQRLAKYVNNPKVTVTVSEIHSKQAFITGEVTRPGEYPLNTQITVLQLIAQAGGFTPFAKTEHIVILRTVNGAQQRIGFKYKEVLRGEKTDQNITVQSGDTVVVP
jgi:polysaccharide biosynthesis/export protein